MAKREQGKWAGLEAKPSAGRKKPQPTSTRPGKQLSPYGRYLDSKGFWNDKTKQVEYPLCPLKERQIAFRDALRSERPFPKEMQFDLACAFAELVEGFSPDLLTPIRRLGRRPPVEKQLQRDAIRYLRWCVAGHIADRSPIKTIASAYKVSVKAVRTWRNTWANEPTPEILEDFGADQVTAFMHASGSQYKRFVPKKPNSNKLDSEL